MGSARGSGNGGAAIAAYAAAGGIKAKILVPAYTQPGKTVQMRAYGAEVELIPGTRQDTADEAERQAERIFCASHNWQAFFLQGTRLAYELWEDLGFRAPDNVLTPTGAGSNVLGCDIGFGELLRRGEIERLPRLFAVQPANCAPLCASFASGAADYMPVETRSPKEPPLQSPCGRARSWPPSAASRLGGPPGPPDYPDLSRASQVGCYFAASLLGLIGCGSANTL